MSRYDIVFIGTAILDTVIKGFDPEPVSVAGYRAESGSINAGGEGVNGSIAAAKLGIYNITGQLLSQQTVSITNGYAEQTLDALPSGCFIARLSDGNGHHATCKFIKK